jgi:hypothetical protein
MRLDTVTMDVLERRYRWLLRAYPAAYRDTHGHEIVSTMLDLAPPHRRHPTLAESTDLLLHAVRCRVGPRTIVALESGATAAAPAALALAAGVSAFLWWHVEPGAPTGLSAGLRGHYTLGPVAYLAWLAAICCRLVLPARAGRTAIQAALAVTLLLPLLAPLLSAHRPPLWVLMALGLFGLLSLAGTGLAGSSRSLHAEDRITLACSATAVMACAELLARLWPATDAGAASYYQPVISQVGLVVAGVVAGLAAVALTRHLRGLPSGPWLWAMLLIGLPGAWLGPLDLRTPHGSWLAIGTGPHFGRLAEVLLGTCLVFAGMAWLSLPQHAERVTVDLRRAGAAVLGYAVGLAVFAGLLGSFTPHVLATVAACSAVALACRAGVGHSRGWLVLSLAGSVLGGLVVGVYGNDWTAWGWQAPSRTVDLAATLCVAPLTWSAFMALRGWLDGRGWARVRPALVAAMSAGWIGYLTVPALPIWGPALLMLLLAVLAFPAAHLYTARRRHRSAPV